MKLYFWKKTYWTTYAASTPTPEPLAVDFLVLISGLLESLGLATGCSLDWNRNNSICDQNYHNSPRGSCWGCWRDCPWRRWSWWRRCWVWRTWPQCRWRTAKGPSSARCISKQNTIRGQNVDIHLCLRQTPIVAPGSNLSRLESCKEGNNPFVYQREEPLILTW